MYVNASSVAPNEGAWGNNVWISYAASSDGVPTNFRLNVHYGATVAEANQNVVESYDNVTVASTTASAPLPSNYVGTVVNSRSEYISFPSISVSSPPTNGGLGVTNGRSKGSRRKLTGRAPARASPRAGSS